MESVADDWQYYWCGEMNQWQAFSGVIGVDNGISGRRLVVSLLWKM